MKLKLVNLLSFAINVLACFSFLPQKGSLMKTFFRSSKEKIRNDVVIDLVTSRLESC